MNHELQKEIEEWRKAREELIKSCRVEKDAEVYACEYGPNYAVWPHNKIQYHLVPKLVDEVGFLNRVIADVSDETSAAETVLRLSDQIRRAKIHIRMIAGNKECPRDGIIASLALAILEGR